MSEFKRFTELLQEGAVKSDDIDDFIHEWHVNYNGNETLSEYLGMTKEQYFKWMSNPSSLMSMFPVKELVTASDKKISKIAMKIAEDGK